MYTIKLANGNTISNVVLNGSMFTTKENISRDIFNGGLSSITIEGAVDDENSVWTPGTYEQLRLSYFRDAGEVKEFCLAFITAEELEALRNRGDIDYIAMMTGVIL